THENLDPLSGEKGAHPVAVGVGSAVGGGVIGGALGSAGAALAGASAMGLAAGPVGAIVGAVAGGVIGGLAGKSVAEKTTPTEEAPWAEEIVWKDYDPTVNDELLADEYDQAYQYGWNAHMSHPDRRFDEIETELRTGWEN